MGLHISSPDLLLNTAAILGRRKLFTAEEAEILALPNVANWWSAGDATLASGITAWEDRKAGQSLTGTSGSSPAITTIGGHPALNFNANGYLSGSGSIPLPNNFTWLVSYQPIATLTTGGILSGTRSADSNGPILFQFADGSIHGNIIAGQQGSSGGGTVAGGANVIVEWSWNGTQMQFGKNGTAGVTFTPATGGASPTPDGFLVGATKGGANLFKGYIYDIIQFNADMRDGAGGHAAQLVTAVAKLQARLP